MATNYQFLMLTSTTFIPKDHEEWRGRENHHTDDLNHIVYKDIEKQALVRVQAAWICIQFKDGQFSYRIGILSS